MDFLKVHMTVELDVKTYVHQVKECWDERNATERSVLTSEGEHELERWERRDEDGGKIFLSRENL